VALKHSIALHQPERCSSPEFVKILASYRADLFVVVAYGEIVNESVLSLPKKGCINLHASLLPKYRGAAPIHRAIIEGETETGVSIMYMVKEMDAGDVIETARLPISTETSYGELEFALREVGANALLEVIHRFERGGVTALPQDKSTLSFAKKISVGECQIDWHQPASTIHNLVRGTHPTPGAWCTIYIDQQPKRLKILRTTVKESSGLPGAILSSTKKDLIVACGKKSLSLLEVKLEGKRSMSAEEMLRGLIKHPFHF
jgi:methionyl-tRNA formyltransferase